MTTTPASPRRVRAGLYEVTDAEGRTWTIEERRADAGYGGQWEWFAASDDGGYLDPLPRLRDAVAAVANL